MAVSAQRPADAPATAPSGKPPDSVFIEELTWAEVRDLIAAGTTNVIIGTAGTEQKGPHMVDGEHKFVMDYTADKIARGMGKTLVAPVVTYVPEGSWENPGGHMGKPGTITLPEDRFVELLVARRPQPQGRRLQEDLVPRRIGRQPHRHAHRGREAERAVERRRDRVLGGRLLHQGARRAEHLGREVPEGRRRSGRQPRQHPRHLRAAVRRAEAHSQAIG